MFTSSPNVLNYCVCWIHIVFTTVCTYYNVFGPVMPRGEHLWKTVSFSPISWTMYQTLCELRLETKKKKEKTGYWPVLEVIINWGILNMAKRCTYSTQTFRDRWWCLVLKSRLRFQWIEVRQKRKKGSETIID